MFLKKLRLVVDTLGNGTENFFIHKVENHSDDFIFEYIFEGDTYAFTTEKPTTSNKIWQFNSLNELMSWILVKMYDNGYDNTLSIGNDFKKQFGYFYIPKTKKEFIGFPNPIKYDFWN